MADIKPFRAVRPKKGLEERIAALPYDVYNREEAKEEVKKEPLSFLKIDRAETQFEDSVDTYADCVYEKAHDILWQMIAEGQFVQDEKACYYIYELTMEGRSQTGIAACASVDDYLNKTIKKHENTRESKEKDRIRHVDACDAQTGPIFLAYRSNQKLSEIIEEEKKKEPVYDFVSTDGISHRIWIITEERKIKEIEDAFKKIGEIYIADGHHRCASAVKVGLKRREENPGYTGKEEFNYFLSVLFPEDQLMIMDYNRVVKDLNDMSEEEFLTKLSEKFVVEKTGDNPVKPFKKGVFGMYLGESWYKLSVHEEICVTDPVERLDVSVLQREVLEPLFHISDPKTDKRIDFVGGIRGLKELEKRVRTDAKVAFSLYPTSIQELFSVADADLLMPPKSTWFEPKLRSGIFIHLLK